MTKAEELKILSDAAKKLGKDSYLGGALLELLPFVESEIRSDIYPDLAGTIRSMEHNLVDSRQDLKEIDEKIKASKKALQDVEQSVLIARERRAAVCDEIRDLVGKLNRCL